MITEEVLKAFNITKSGRLLKGGQGESMLYGDIVIKPVDNQEYYEYTAELFNRLNPKEYRISRPIKSTNGSFSYEGYAATQYELGDDFDGRVFEKLLISNILHQDLALLGVEELLKSDDPWSRAHRMLWGKMKFSGNSEVEMFCNKLLDELPDHEEEYQLIHSDLGGNILFDEDLLPLVIDFSPAIAPKKFADAVIVCDSIAWANQPMTTMGLLDSSYHSMILYAIAFRVITIALFEKTSIERVYEEWEAYKPVWECIKS